MANAHLKRNVTSVGNRKTWTWAGWLKIGKDFGDSHYNTVWSVATGTSSNNSDRFHLYHYTGGRWVTTGTTSFSAVFTAPGGEDIRSRDPSGWMHVCLSVDTTISSSTRDHEQRFWVNGVEYIYDSVGNIGQNVELAVNGPYEHYIGTRNSAAQRSYDGQMCDLYLVDGLALTPEVFGFHKEGAGYVSAGTPKATDFRGGQWVPHSPKKIKSDIESRGGFGVNGFYLPMNDSSNPGADFHCTPNTIIKLKGEDLPQPRAGAPETTDAYISQLREDPYANHLVFAIPGISTSNSGNLITNGSFDTGTSNWTATDCSLAWEDGRQLKITRSGGSGLTANQSFPTAIGKRYTVQGTINSVQSRGDLRVYSGSGTGGGQLVGLSGTNGAEVDLAGSFVATSNTSTVIIAIDNNNSYVYADNISVVQEDGPKDYSADIKGYGANKTVTTTTYNNITPSIISGQSQYGSYIDINAPNNNGGYMDVHDSVAFDQINTTSAEWTAECWIKRTNFDGNAGAVFQLGNTTDYQNISLSIHDSGRIYFIWSYDGSNWSVLTNTGGPVVPANEWCHIAFVKEASPTSKITCYLNGVASKTENVTSNMSYTSPNYLRIAGHYRGTSGGGDGYFYSGSMYDIRWYNTAKYRGGFDVSKHYMPINILSWAEVPDSPGNNFCTLNPIGPEDIAPFNGNLSIDQSSGGWHTTMGTHYVSSGKWYAEARIDQIGWLFFGIDQTWLDTSQRHIGGQVDSKGVGIVYNTGNRGDITYNGSNSVYTGADATASTGDILSIAMDLDNNNVKFYKNGIVQYDLTGILEPGAQYSFGLSPYGFVKATVNFGQNPSFAGATTAGTYKDHSGKGLFKYQPPEGYMALCEDNMPRPAISNPGEYFKSVLYVGDSSIGHSVSGVGFQPDLVWIKCRNQGKWHALVDVVRGTQKTLHSNDPSAEVNERHVQSFDEKGFTVDDIDSGTANEDDFTYVAWCWKAGGPAVTNTDGSLSVQVSANPKAGFSIVRTETTSYNAGTAGHGLDATPKFIIQKPINASGNWNVQHHHMMTTSTGKLLFNSTAAVVSSSTPYMHNANDTTFEPVFSSNQIAYCWTEVEGYSKFGRYTGNGNTNGPFAYCGFKPAWVMIKNVTVSKTGHWVIWDSSRTPANLATNALTADNPMAETSGFDIDLVSNGFKMRDSEGSLNTDGDLYIFAAFAESPFQTATAK